ncbi:MAG: hypothetical protein IH600_00250 [Bacteroidetes bacterium]|nr:hypothetical protein [Bacteroidota bacterium]
MTRKITLFVSVISVIVLGIIILLPGNPGIDAPDAVEASPAEQLEFFLTDKMDYGLRFSRILAERRIEKARRFAKDDPALEGHARVVIDSLTARLGRNAKM